MAHLWWETCDGRWDCKLLDSDAYLVTGCEVAQLNHGPVMELSPGTVILRRTGIETGERWAAITSHDSTMHVNGAALTLGIGVLSDRDEILMDEPGSRLRRRLFFSTEKLPRVETFSASAPVTCPRCKMEIQPRCNGVRCPSCGVWHHEQPDRPCWTYAAQCAACQSQSTELNGAFRWTPDEL